MNASTAFNMFARAVLREHKLPFDVVAETDPFYSESNIAYLRKVKADADKSKNMSVHELASAEDD